MNAVSRVRALVVDDSATMRHLIRTVLSRDPGIDVVATAASAAEAREAIKAFSPDVVTLDVEMPAMSGLSLLEKIMRLRPMPVVMVSSLTREGADTTLRALEIGAVDCVAKPRAGEGGTPFADLAERVRCAARARVRGAALPVPAPRPPAPRVFERAVVGIGASTGGVEALIAVLSAFPETCPPTVITQHMPEGFTARFAERLDRLCAPRVEEARDGAPLRSGMIYLAPGGERHLLVGPSAAGELRCILRAAPPVNGHRPSVDVLFRSMAELQGPRLVAALLTGMGRDGADGMRVLRQRGARTLGQDEESCVVYGMPRVAWEIGAVERQCPLERMGTALLALCEAR